MDMNEGLKLLRRVDNNDCLLREPVVLRAIQLEPGKNGSEIAAFLRYHARSAIQACLTRMEKKGLVEDRRVTQRQAEAAIFFITPKGEALLKKLFAD